MSRAASKAPLGPIAVCAVLALTGCKRAEVVAAEAAQKRAYTYTDPDTGCEYFAHMLSGSVSGPRLEPFTPRIADDGKAHMGCNQGGKP